MFRKLRADEIDVRVSTVKENGCSLLLYKDARVDQRLLDETFGIFGWQRKHELIGGNLYCTVSVRNPETGEWIEKQDVGTEEGHDQGRKHQHFGVLQFSGCLPPVSGGERGFVQGGRTLTN